MKRKILMSILVVVITVIMVSGATITYFSDTETSVGNTITAGTLDLQIDGGDNNVVKFNLTNLKPGSQPTRSYLFSNIGSIDGYLNISNINVENLENDLTEPEIEAGDTTADVGELGDVLSISLFVDYNGDGWFSTGDKTIYSGKISNMPDKLIFNEKIPASQSVRISAIINWWSSANDNLAQSDTVNFDFEFTLSQVQAA